MPSTASTLNRNPHSDHREALEMDTLPQAPTHGRSISQARHSVRSCDKSPVAPESSLDKKDYAIGIVLLLAVVFLWTSSNFITQDLFEEGYEKPFFVTYMNTSAFSFYLLPFAVKKAWRNYRGTSDDSRRPMEDYQPLATDINYEDGTEAILALKPEKGRSLPPLTVKETAKLASIFCFFWFIANWAVNASLDFTSVASATVLSSMSGFFTLGIGRVFKVERLTLLKIGAVVVSFFGVVLVSWSDSQSTNKPAGPASHPKTTQATAHAPRPVLGDALALISALFYALYVILLKVKIKSESRVDMQLFFGFVGLFNVLSCWPIGLVLHLTGTEVFELPSSKKMLAAVLMNMAITLSSDYLYVLAMLKTTPLVVTVGLSLTIPFAVIGDFFRGRPSQGQIILGALLVLISFIAIGVDNRNGDPEEELPGAPVDSAPSGEPDRTM